MKRNQHQVTSKSSRPIAAPQPKTTQSKAGNSPAPSQPEEVAWPSKPDYGRPGCLCIYDRAARAVVEEVPLSEDEYCAGIIEAIRRGIYPQQFFADAIREKLDRLSGEASSPFKGGLTAVLYNPDGTEWTRVYFNASERHRIEAFLKSTGLTLIALLEKAVSNRAARLTDQRRAA
jgi:hypothetical protein